MLDIGTTIVGKRIIPTRTCVLLLADDHSFAKCVAERLVMGGEEAR